MSQALEPLYAEITTFLGGHSCQPTRLDSGKNGDLTFWRDHSSITDQEITMLAAVAKRPAPIQAVADILARDFTVTQEFLDALVAIGVLERAGDLYGATAATRLYLQAITDQSIRDHSNESPSG